MEQEKDSKKEVERLKQIISAYEKLTEFSHKELLNAETTIKAQERLQSLSRKEMLALYDRIYELQSESDFYRTIRELLGEDKKNEELLFDELNKLNALSDKNFYVDFFRVIVNHDFPEDEAKKYWEAIVSHSREMKLKLGRSVGFRVALLDYFINLNKQLKNPMIIELALFDSIIKNTIIDDLTGVYNRRYFDRSFTRETNRARRHNRKVCVFVFDIDNFKAYNDTYGHTTGDEILAKIGDLMNAMFRKEDIPCRYGGEEFAIILPETDCMQAELVCNRFQKELKKLPFFNGEITISGGISCFPKHGEDPGTVFLQADRALYKAKELGKNKIISLT